MTKRIVIALGGNALEKNGLPPTAESQLQVIKETVKYIADIISEGYEVIISHGNGPQVGRILLASEGAAELTPSMPFDVCGAMSQGYIGYHLQQSLQEELKSRQMNKEVATIITQVVVDKNDSSFQNLTKPIGPFYTEEEANVISSEKGYSMQEDSGRGWRRVVASPQPTKIVELKSIQTLLANNTVVIAAGGGGIPVVEDGNKLYGVDAVIDKDLACEKLAEELNADMLLILTEVEKVCINFNQPNQQQLDECTVKEMEKLVKEGHFAPGSMLPKVRATMKFANSKSGRVALISSLDYAKQALDGTSGTRITKG